ncbi:MAG: chondroitinase-B domain-containing protein [Geminicoccaceae bacterium]
MPLGRRNFLHGVLALPAFPLATHGTRVGSAPVRDGEELADALSRARPGDTILLAPGEFGGVDEFTVSVPDVTIRASVPLGSILRAPMEVPADRATIDGLMFRSEPESGLLLAAVAACRDSLSITGSNTEVRGCDFGYFPGRAILVRPTGKNPYIHDCTFHNNNDGGDRGGNAHEAISLGYDNPNSRVSLRGRVTNNRFWNLNVEGEAVSVKTSDNLLQNNQLSSSRGGFTSRYGQRNQFIGNRISNSRGIAIGGRGCKVANNTISGTGNISIQAGNASADNTRNGVHPQSADTTVEGNSGLLLIGNQYRPMPALNTTVRNHKGTVRLVLQQGTKQS